MFIRTYDNQWRGSLWGCKLWLWHGVTSSCIIDQTFTGSLKHSQKQLINVRRRIKTLQGAQGLQKQKYTQDFAVWTLLVASNNKKRLNKIANKLNKSLFIRFKSQRSSADESPGYCKCNKARLAPPFKNNRLFQMCFLNGFTAKTYIRAFPSFHSIYMWHMGTFLHHLCDHRCEYIPPI